MKKSDKQDILLFPKKLMKLQLLRHTQEVIIFFIIVKSSLVVAKLHWQMTNLKLRYLIK